MCIFNRLFFCLLSHVSLFIFTVSSVSWGYLSITCNCTHIIPLHFFSSSARSYCSVKKDKLKKEKEKNDQKAVLVKNSSINKTTVSSSSAASSGSNNNNSSSAPNNNNTLDRKHLHNYRVVQRNLVYVIGMPSNTASEETVRSANYFGQYGKITKTVIHKNSNISLSTVSAYCTFWNREDAKAAIQALDGYWLEGHQLRASFGTTKYCNSFVRGVSCSNPDCVYLHDYGEDEDRYTKEDIVNPTIAVTSVNPANSTNKSIANTLITGMGGPSGTGRRPIGEPVLPPPVFTQESAIAAGNQAVIQQVAAAAAAAEKAEKAALNPKVATGPKPSSWAGMAAGASVVTASTPVSVAAATGSAVAETKTELIGGPPLVVGSESVNSSSSSNSSNYSSSTAHTNAAVVDGTPPLHPQQKSLQQPQNQAQSIASTIASGGGTSLSGSASSTKSVKKDGPGAAAVLVQMPVGVAPATVVTPGTSSASPVQVPAVTPSPVNIPNPTPLLATHPTYQYNSYNGFGKCAVFPVPTSTYHLSIWHKVMNASSSDLSVNPFAMYTSLPIADLLELTLPTVDAIGNMPMWPRPLSYYYTKKSPVQGQGQIYSGSNNNNSPNSANPIANLTPQQLALLQQQMLQSQNAMGGQVQQNQIQQQGQYQNMAMLQQIFPGVKRQQNM